MIVKENVTSSQVEPSNGCHERQYSSQVSFWRLSGKVGRRFGYGVMNVGGEVGWETEGTSRKNRRNSKTEPTNARLSSKTFSHPSKNRA